MQSEDEAHQQAFSIWMKARDEQVRLLADRFSISPGVVLGIYFTMSLFFETHPMPKLPLPKK
jgi:hypothetical protein